MIRSKEENVDKVNTFSVEQYRSFIPRGVEVELPKTVSISDIGPEPRPMGEEYEPVEIDVVDYGPIWSHCDYVGFVLPLNPVDSDILFKVHDNTKQDDSLIFIHGDEDDLKWLLRSQPDVFKEKVFRTLSMTKEEIDYRNCLIQCIRAYCLDTRNICFENRDMNRFYYAPYPNSLNLMGFTLGVDGDGKRIFDDYVGVIFPDLYSLPCYETVVAANELGTKLIEAFVSVINSDVLENISGFKSKLSEIEAFSPVDWFKQFEYSGGNLIMRPVIASVIEAFPVGSNNDYFSNGTLLNLSKVLSHYDKYGDNLLLDFAINSLSERQQKIAIDVFSRSYSKYISPNFQCAFADMKKNQGLASKKPLKGNKKGI